MRSEASRERRFWALIWLSAAISAALVLRPGAVTPVRAVVEVGGSEAGIYALSEAVEPPPARDPLLVGQQIDVNTATESMLDEIPGVGATQAAAIVAGRSQRIYRDLADVDARVPRLSGAGLDGIATFATFRGPFPPEVAPPHRTPPARQARRARPIARKTDPNTASSAELERLPGVGPAMAARIVADRAARGAYATADDLDRVPGIGPATIEKLRPLLDIH